MNTHTLSNGNKIVAIYVNLQETMILTEDLRTILAVANKQRNMIVYNKPMVWDKDLNDITTICYNAKLITSEHPHYKQTDNFAMGFWNPSTGITELI
jgi:hypothetical protein